MSFTYGLGTLQSAASVLGLKVSEFVRVPFKSRVRVSYSSPALLDTSPAGFQTQMLLWGLIFLVQVPRAGVPDVGLEPLSP